MIKPDLKLYFAEMPEIGIWLAWEYSKANTFEEIASLFHNWKTREETTSNEVKRHCLKGASNYLYSYLTGLSFESKKYQEI